MGSAVFIILTHENCIILGDLWAGSQPKPLSGRQRGVTQWKPIWFDKLLFHPFFPTKLSAQISFHLGGPRGNFVGFPPIDLKAGLDSVDHDAAFH